MGYVTTSPADRLASQLYKTLWAIEDGYTDEAVSEGFGLLVELGYRNDRHVDWRADPDRVPRKIASNLQKAADQWEED